MVHREVGHPALADPPHLFPRQGPDRDAPQQSGNCALRPTAALTAKPRQNRRSGHEENNLFQLNQYFDTQ